MLYAVADCSLQIWPCNYIYPHLLFWDIATLPQEMESIAFTMIPSLWLVQLIESSPTRGFSSLYYKKRHNFFSSQLFFVYLTPVICPWKPATILWRSPNHIERPHVSFTQHLQLRSQSNKEHQLPDMRIGKPAEDSRPQPSGPLYPSWCQVNQKWALPAEPYPKL